MENQQRVCKGHVLAMPFSAQGHINPMIQFSKRLASKGLQVTLVTFSDKELMQTQFGSVKVVTVSMKSVDDNMTHLKNTAMKKLPELIASLSNSSGCPISCLVYDSTLPWVLDIAKHFGLIAAVLFTQSCAVSAIYYQIHEGTIKQPFEKLPVLSFSGLPPLDADELPSFTYNIRSKYAAFFHSAVGQLSNFTEADWIFFNTFNSLEEEVTLRTQLYIYKKCISILICLAYKW